MLGQKRKQDEADLENVKELYLLCQDPNREQLVMPPSPPSIYPTSHYSAVKLYPANSELH